MPGACMLGETVLKRVSMRTGKSRNGALSLKQADILPRIAEAGESRRRPRSPPRGRL